MARPDHLLRRLRSLAALELLNIPLQAWVWFTVAGFPATAANLTGFALVALLLVQGAAYWTAKGRRLATGRTGLPAARAFAVARVANPVLLTASTGFTLWAAVSAPGRGSLPGLAFALFAWLEQINYFHVQLMYDNAADLRRFRAHGFRRGPLARNLARERRSGPSRQR
ncbi:hypothetical protein [Phytomonospora endophytica]|uniref:Uncharacterized protein n=1 Tax=Phytomonospora endophytica TaxID=714109 RepID=A0A841FLR7_9ACTN|nr:hypothetical protein [Phytomonospora endophytica]MBB6036925.1 hypothetical protein [Phytomonospora endophytica]GIG68044.1 hypothetical protein Pen01_43390 [Phytomonospora endophytica]